MSTDTDTLPPEIQQLYGSISPDNSSSSSSSGSSSSSTPDAGSGPETPDLSSLSSFNENPFTNPLYLSALMLSLIHI